MDSFKKYFNIAKPTENSRQQHQNLLRSPIRKHQNQVGYVHGYKGKKEDPIIDNIVKNEKYGFWNISYDAGLRLARTYGLTHDPKRKYSKAIKQTGIILSYYPPAKAENEEEQAGKGKFYVSRSEKKK